MLEVTFILANGEKTTVHAKAGDSLMAVAVANSVQGIVAECGGAMACATCHCHVDPDWIAAVGLPSEMEADMLEFCEGPVGETSRLSCQIVLSGSLNGLVVEVPKAP